MCVDGVEFSREGRTDDTGEVRNFFSNVRVGEIRWDLITAQFGTLSQEDGQLAHQSNTRDGGVMSLWEDIWEEGGFVYSVENFSTYLVGLL